MITLRSWLITLTIIACVGVAISVIASIAYPRFIPLACVALYSFPIAIARIMYNRFTCGKPYNQKWPEFKTMNYYTAGFGEDLAHYWLDTARRLVLPTMILTIAMAVLMAYGIIGPI